MKDIRESKRRKLQKEGRGILTVDQLRVRWAKDYYGQTSSEDETYIYSVLAYEFARLSCFTEEEYLKACETALRRLQIKKSNEK